MEISNVPGKLIVVKSWQAVLTLIAWLVLSVLQFANVRAQTEENTKNIEQLKTDKVSREHFDDTKEEILRRLDRIEKKIDEQKAVREGN